MSERDKRLKEFMKAAHCSHLGFDDLAKLYIDYEFTIKELREEIDGLQRSEAASNSHAEMAIDSLRDIEIENERLKGELEVLDSQRAIKALMDERDKLRGELGEAREEAERWEVSARLRHTSILELQKERNEGLGRIKDLEKENSSVVDTTLAVLKIEQLEAERDRYREALVAAQVGFGKIKELSRARLGDAPQIAQGHFEATTQSLQPQQPSDVIQPKKEECPECGGCLEWRRTHYADGKPENNMALVCLNPKCKPQGEDDEPICD